MAFFGSLKIWQVADGIYYRGENELYACNDPSGRAKYDWVEWKNELTWCWGILR